MGLKKRKILMLGGAYSQIPAIQYAKNAGYYVVTCDYLPGNPGHVLSDEYHNVSTTDKEKVLQLAEKLKIDGIVAYASDPSAPSAAYVSDALRLPGASFNSVQTLAEKDLFRDFLRKNSFSSPKHVKISTEASLEEVESLKFPVYVKPVDCSGSKGIRKIEQKSEVEDAVKYALSFSRCKRAVIEEYIDSPYDQLHGDGFVFEGKLVFLGLGDQHFKKAAPIGTTYPSKAPRERIESAFREVQNIITKAGFENGAINVEARITENGEVYILEIGPRSGGNYVPQLMECGTGFDEVAAIIETAMGNKPSFFLNEKPICCFQYIIGSDASGEFLKLQLSEEMQGRVMRTYLHKKAGDAIDAYESSSNVVGVLIAKCRDEKDLQATFGDIRQHVEVKLK